MGLLTSASEEALARELLAAMQRAAAASSQTAELLATGVRNNVLEVSTRVFDAEGRVSLSWQSTAGCIEVSNLTDADITVAAGATAVQPLAGVGCYVVPAGAVIPVNVNSREVTLFGDVAGRVSVQVWTIGYRPTGAKLGGLNGGAP